MVRILHACLAVAALIATLAPAAAQPFPNRTITLVVPLPPGGTNDIMAHIIGERMTKSLGQQIVVENRAAGGSGTVATRQVARATPDGYTILLSYTTRTSRPARACTRTPAMTCARISRRSA